MVNQDDQLQTRLLEIEDKVQSAQEQKAKFNNWIFTFEEELLDDFGNLDKIDREFGEDEFLSSLEQKAYFSRLFDEQTTDSRNLLSKIENSLEEKRDELILQRRV